LSETREDRGKGTQFELAEGGTGGDAVVGVEAPSGDDDTK